MGNYVLLHGYKSGPDHIFFPWLKSNLVNVQIPALPNADLPTKEQVEYVLKHVQFDKETILFGHSLGTVVALKVLERLPFKIAGVVLAAGFLKPEFKDKKRPMDFEWQFDFKKIKRNAGFFTVIADKNDAIVPLGLTKEMAQKINATYIEVKAEKPHFTGQQEPELLKYLHH